MRELVPGIFHWTAFRETIRQPVSSYYVEPAAALIDPMLPQEGLEWFERHERPQRVLLTNRHHYRDSSRFADAFGCTVLCSEPGLHEFGDGQVEGFAFGAEVAPGITALEVGGICPDESALHIAAGDGALAVADGVIRHEGGPLAFVPDFLMGDDPVAVKTALLRSYAGLLDHDFSSLLLAHGDPLVADGKTALAQFVDTPAQADFNG
jgi:hypothetical protein